MRFTTAPIIMFCPCGKIKTWPCDRVANAVAAWNTIIASAAMSFGPGSGAPADIYPPFSPLGSPIVPRGSILPEDDSNIAGMIARACADVAAWDAGDGRLGRFPTIPANSWLFVAGALTIDPPHYGFLALVCGFYANGNACGTGGTVAATPFIAALTSSAGGWGDAVVTLTGAPASTINILLDNHGRPCCKDTDGDCIRGADDDCDGLCNPL